MSATTAAPCLPAATVAIAYDAPNFGHAYAFAGECAAAIADGAAKSPEVDVRGARRLRASLVCDEVLGFPSSAHLAQAGLHAAAVRR